MKIRSKICGELIAILILMIILLWFFLINYNPAQITSTAIVSGILLLLCFIWGIISLIRFLRL
jgi:hypothetical protein